jgi:hypothetical protein
MPATEWKLGDRLMHAGRPEWGIGEVRGAEAVVQDGVKCQRLTIRFDRAGVKTISTAFADLRPASEMPTLEPMPESSSDSGWLEQAETTPIRDRLSKLPEPTTDPFRTKRARLEATLGLYRFTGGGASILDWASTQTGLKDPLSRFSRQELEGHFDRFKVALDAHLKRLVQELKREDPSALAELASSAPPLGRQALKRLDGFR